MLTPADTQTKISGKSRKQIYEKHKKAILACACVLSFLPVGIWAYNNVPIVKIGSHSSTYTYGDLGVLTDFAKQVAAVTGESTRGLSRHGVFQSLVLSGAEKEILSSEKVQINRDVATKMLLENSPCKGLLEKEKTSLGDDRFYTLFVEPAAVGELFQGYYTNKDPKHAIATEAVAAAKISGLEVAAQKAGLQVRQIELPRVPQNEKLAEAVKQGGEGKILDQPVEDGQAFYIVRTGEVTDRSIKVSAIEVPRTPPGAFIRDQMSAKGIPMADRFYSVYRLASLEKPGMIFAKEPAAPAAK